MSNIEACTPPNKAPHHTQQNARSQTRQLAQEETPSRRRRRTPRGVIYPTEIQPLALPSTQDTTFPPPQCHPSQIPSDDVFMSHDSTSQSKTVKLNQQVQPSTRAASNRSIAQRERHAREREARQHALAQRDLKEISEADPQSKQCQRRRVKSGADRDSALLHNTTPCVNGTSTVQSSDGKSTAPFSDSDDALESSNHVVDYHASTMLQAPNRKRLGAARRPYKDPKKRLDLGPMNVNCSSCGALHWMQERLDGSTKALPRFGICCDSGKVRLPRLQSPPEELRKLYEEQDKRSLEFRDHIRWYNMALAFTSLGVQADTSVNDPRLHGRSGWVFRIEGQLSHYFGALSPEQGASPSYAQLYIYDHDTALRHRMYNNSMLDESTMETLQQVIIRHHRYAPLFKQAYEILREHENTPNYTLRLRVLPGQDPRRYNLPTAAEIAIILPGDGTAEEHRDIILRTRDDKLQRIHEGHISYSALHYVLLFPYGEDGWHQELTLYEPDRPEPRGLSQTRYAAFRLQVRRDEWSTILRGGKLFQQYIVDMWAAANQVRLSYLRFHQSELRASLYSGLEDALGAHDDNVDLSTLGQRYILPSSYIGGPRHLQQLFQDAMAIARYYRKVDLFITMTANPEWPEVTRELLPGQTSYDRPDLVTRVFRVKFRLLVKEIREHGIFGEAVAYVYAIEFQKRNLPHGHILIVLKDGFKILTPADIDSIICAEWPNPNTQPLLFETIRRSMVYGPCSVLDQFSPCMKNGRCSKYYPKEFQEFTSMNTDGYPLYCRRDDGRSYKVRRHMLDNRWIVPYNPYLSAKFDCHINVECVATLRSIKYPFKYIHKGGDRATIEWNQDEIKRYIDGRYIGPHEGLWRIYHFPLHAQMPNVVRLQVHLPGQHMVVFDPNEDPDVLLQRAATEKTTLTQFFQANAEPGLSGQIARSLTYQEFPQKFVWDTDKRKWKLRQKGFALGRMYFVSPTAGERFYLWTLLTIVKGPRSYLDLRTVDGSIYTTFQEACIAYGILSDDGEWRLCLQEAGQMQTGSRLRELFAILLLFCNPTHPDQLWDEFRPFICDDLAYRLSEMGYKTPSDAEVNDYGLFLLNCILMRSGRNLSEFPPMPCPQKDWEAKTRNPLITEQLSYDCDTEKMLADSCLLKLNRDQRAAFDVIFDSVVNNKNHVYFLNGPAGTGKTFVYNTVCHVVRSRSWIALCVASSGVASLLLHGGRTAHSTFRIPIDTLNDESIYSISKESQRAELLRETKLIIWDEVLMQHRNTVEALDRTLRDICDDNRPFGGKAVVFGADPMQTLPVIPRASQQEIISATLFRSYIWQIVKVLHLRHNMRLDQASSEEVAFAKWLLEVGKGINIAQDGTISLPNHMRVPDSQALISFVYPDLDGPTPPPLYFLDRIILSARNYDVESLNNEILDRMHGEKLTFRSADAVEVEQGADNDSNQVPVEYLRSVEASGFPPGELHLKVGCPIILLQNLAPCDGLCNGTRLIVVRASCRVIEARILGGEHDGKTVFIPRITLHIPSSAGLTFNLRRCQFPVRLAFAISINKAQGQSVKIIGLDLRIPVFSHGQLYVALSRATSSHRLKILLPYNQVACRTMNIVYPEILASLSNL